MTGERVKRKGALNRKRLLVDWLYRYDQSHPEAEQRVYTVYYTAASKFWDKIKNLKLFHFLLNCITESFVLLEQAKQGGNDSSFRISQRAPRTNHHYQEAHRE